MRVVSFAFRLLPLISATALATLSCGGSATEPVVIPNPVPGINVLAPTGAIAGGGDVTLTVDGSDFVASSVVTWDGASRQTAYVSGTRLTATIGAIDIASSGLHQITVVNPAPGGGTSNMVLFTVQQVQVPAPTLTAISPTSASVGSGDVAMTLTGTNFLAGSSVIFAVDQSGGVQVPTTYVSGTTLTATLPAAQLLTSRTYQVTVNTLYGVSNPRPFAVTAPAPTLTALSHASATAGADDDTLIVDGTNFIQGSTVRFNGGIRNTTFVSSSRLRAILVAGDLVTPGTYSITVVNAPPGGGTSAALAFQVIASPPRISELPAAGGVAGRPGFSLSVDGVNFTSGAVVQWNGADRPTTVRSGRRLTATISSSDVATPTVASITVRNPGVSTISNAMNFTVRTLAPAVTTSQVVVDVPASDLAYDPVSALLYASVPSTGGLNGNSIVAIDPVTGTVTKSIFIGSEPEFLAVSDNGQYLYVSLRGASSVRRVALGDFTPGLEFSVGNGAVVEEMAVVPGAPNSVVLSKMNTGSSPRHLGVFAYDDGIQRGVATPGHTGSNSITYAGETAKLFGYNNETTDFGFRTMVLDADGLHITTTTGGLVSAFYTRITGASGRVYATNGAIVDPELLVRTGSFAPNTLGATVGISADAALGRVFFLANGTIEAFDMNTMQSLGSVAAPAEPTEHPAQAREHLVRWGTDGLAYRAGGKVYVLRTTLSAP
jgi:hypothetical protein